MTFDREVSVVTGVVRPTIGLTIGESARNRHRFAGYAGGSPGRELRFVYLVQSVDFDDNGVNIGNVGFQLTRQRDLCLYRRSNNCQSKFHLVRRLNQERRRPERQSQLRFAGFVAEPTQGEREQRLPRRCRDLRRRGAHRAHLPQEHPPGVVPSGRHGAGRGERQRPDHGQGRGRFARGERSRSGRRHRADADAGEPGAGGRAA